MDQKEIESILAKLQKVGFGLCESCRKQLAFAEIELHNGYYLCPECMRKEIWKVQGEVDLPAN